MKKILGLAIGAAAVIGLVASGTWAVFNDTETSTPNTFCAGIIDLEVDCAGDTVFSPMDDPLPPIFAYCPSNDIKPGYSGEVTLSLHLKEGSNNADLWMGILNLGPCPNPSPATEPECEAEGGTWNNTTNMCEGIDNQWVPVDDICDQILIKLWVDDGATDGWQNSDGGTANDDSEEGDNTWQDGEEVLTAPGATLDDLDAAHFDLIDNAVACTTYYVGWAWELPIEVDNEYQGDCCCFDIVFGADQIVPVAPAGTAADGWSSVATCPCWDPAEDLWFARARYGQAGNWFAAIGEDNPFAVWAQGPNGTPFNSSFVYPFELDYDEATDTATFTIDMVNDPDVQTDVVVTYTNAVVTSDGALSIDIQSPVTAGDTTVLDNVKLNGMALTGDDGLTATGTGSAVVRHLCVCGNDADTDFTLTGDFTFTWTGAVGQGAGETPKMQIVVGH